RVGSSPTSGTNHCTCCAYDCGTPCPSRGLHVEHISKCLEAPASAFSRSLIPTFRKPERLLAVPRPRSQPVDRRFPEVGEARYSASGVRNAQLTPAKDRPGRCLREYGNSPLAILHGN